MTQPATGFLLAGRYRLSHELAHGGMGYVWVADDETSEQRVAIKFQAGPRRDAIADRRFRREAQALAQLESPHIVRVLTSGTDAGLSYIVMELLQGETLRQRCAARGPVEPAQAVAWIRQAAEGLGVAHRAGIIHRDLKPSNLFLASAPTGEVLKIIDFGIAKGHMLDGTSDGTASGLIGSPCYMSPEQARGESVDARSDLWALGVVAFQLLSGREPFMGANVPQTLQRICSGSVPRISEFVGELPSSLDAFFRRAFAADRALRFESAAELAQAFARACEGEAPQGLVGRSDTTQSIAMQMASVRPARARRPRVILGAAAAVGLIGVMLWRVAPKVEEPRRELASHAQAAAFSAEVVGPSPSPSPSPNAPPAVLLSAAPLPSSTVPAAATLPVRHRPIAPKPSATAQAVPPAPTVSPPPPKPEASRPTVDKLDRRF